MKRRDGSSEDAVCVYLDLFSYEGLKAWISSLDLGLAVADAAGRSGGVGLFGALVVRKEREREGSL